MNEGWNRGRPVHVQRDPSGTWSRAIEQGRREAMDQADSYARIRVEMAQRAEKDAHDALRRLEEETAAKIAQIEEVTRARVEAAEQAAERWRRNVLSGQVVVANEGGEVTVVTETEGSLTMVPFDAPPAEPARTSLWTRVWGWIRQSRMKP